MRVRHHPVSVGPDSSNVRVISAPDRPSPGGGVTPPVVPSSGPIPPRLPTGAPPLPDRQPRESLVPCRRCGADLSYDPPRVRTWTGNLNRDCGDHELSRPGLDPAPAPRPAPGTTVRRGW